MFFDPKRKDLLHGWILYPAAEQVCYVVLVFSFPPAFLFRPPSGATFPPGEGFRRSCANAETQPAANAAG